MHDNKQSDQWRNLHITFVIMRKVNYKSDFDFVMRLKDASGKEVPFPECDWDAEFWTSSKQNAYRASCIGGEYVNCFREADGSIHFIFDNHRLGVGALKWEPHFELPNGLYPDGVQDLYKPDPLDIELVSGAGDCGDTAEVEAMLPYIKGEPFTYEDFTPEQIADLKRPATEAAERADKAVRAAEKATQEAVASNKQLAGNVAEAAGAETERVEAETARVTAETQRQSAEDTRKANEVERVKAEGLRDSNEATRESQEAERQSAETDRINAEKARVSAEASRVAAETKRASDFTEAEAQRQSTFESAEAERAQAEATRVSNENIRISNEQLRVNAEHTRASQETARQDAENARQSNEQSRVTAEGARVEAENARATEFAGFADTIAAKQDKLTTSEDLSLSEENELSLTDMAKKRLFIDMWNTAWGKYGKYDPVNAPDPQHPFYGNEIWMTYKEAVVVYSWGNKLIEKGFSASGTTAERQIRTNLPPINTAQRIYLNLSSLFINQQKMEVCMLTPPEYSWVHLIHLNNTWLTSVFTACMKLRKVLGIMDLSYFKTGDNIFSGCVSLEDIQIFGLKANFDISSCPKFSVGTMSYLVNNAANTTPITVKVHPDVYAKLTDETNADWNQVLLDAAEKNIIFATPT